MIRTKEHNKKIGNGVRKHYQQETKEERDERIFNLKKSVEVRENLKKELHTKLDELFELYTKLKS